MVFNVLHKWYESDRMYLEENQKRAFRAQTFQYPYFLYRWTEQSDFIFQIGSDNLKHPIVTENEKHYFQSQQSYHNAKKQIYIKQFSW